MIIAGIPASLCYRSSQQIKKQGAGAFPDFSFLQSL